MHGQIPRADWPRLIPLGIVAASLGALGVAYTAQYAFGLEPCILCLYQRLPYGVAAGLGLLALVLPSGREDRALVVALSGLVFLVGAVLAVYHVGVEQHWWASAAGCGGKIPGPMSIEEFRARLAAKPPKPCDAVDWSLFGISMAGYNAIASLALAVGCFAGARILRRA